MKNISLVIMISASLFAGNMLSVSSATDDGAGNVSFTLAYSFEDDVAGFQFDLMTDGVVELTGAEGGASGDAGFMISTNASGTVIGFSLTGATIAAGAGDFVTVSGTYDVTAVGSSVLVEAYDSCNDDGTAGCDDDDTRMVLSNSAGEAVESDFHEAAWDVGTGTVTLGNDIDLKPHTYSLSNNFPNPFNPSTTINYSVEIAGDVSIIVYDMMGREVKTLVSSYKTPSAYSVIWDAKNDNGVEVSAGMYIYKMISGDFVKVNKMLLVK